MASAFNEPGAICVIQRLPADEGTMALFDAFALNPDEHTRLGASAATPGFATSTPMASRRIAYRTTPPRPPIPRFTSGGVTSISDTVVINRCDNR